MTELFLNQGVDRPLRQITGAAKRIAVIRGNKSYPEALMKEALQGVHSQDSVIEFSGFSPNPKYEEFQKGLEALRDFQPDLVVGCGGGSILDMAKMLRYFAATSGTDEEIANALKGGPVTESAAYTPSLVLMPTTAGSGAESTEFSVIYFGSAKYSFLRKELKPDFVIADPALIRHAPGSVLASSAMDAISQSIESIWARGATSESRQDAREALLLMWGSAADAILTRSEDSLKNIIKGSNLAGQAINVSKTTGNHALSYRITSDYGVPHGHCVGMLLPEFFKLHEKLWHQEPQRAQSAIAAQSEIYSALGFGSSAELVAGFVRFIEELGLESFATLNSRYSFDAAPIVDSVNVERLGNHPIELTRDDLLSLFA